MVDDWSSSAAFRDVVIVGGGCYGTFYTGQLLRAAERDRARFRRLLIPVHDQQAAEAGPISFRGTQQLPRIEGAVAASPHDDDIAKGRATGPVVHHRPPGSRRLRSHHPRGDTAAPPPRRMDFPGGAAGSSEPAAPVRRRCSLPAPTPLLEQSR